MRGGDLTRQKIKRAAQALFAERGFNAVSIKDILEAAEQRNAASLHYYFRTKDALARELVADGARRIDEDRNQRLDKLEAGGGPHSIRDLIELLAYPFFVDDDFMRFLSRLMQDNYGLFLEGAKGQDSGFMRLIAHMCGMIPDMPNAILYQRFHLMIVYLASMIALRVRGHQDDVWSQFWKSPGAEETLLDTVEGMLRQPVSAEAMAAVTVKPRKRPKAG